MTNPVPSLPGSIVHRLANHLSIADQRAMRRLDPRFGELADTDWAVPLLHRVSRLMEHVQASAAGYDWEQSIQVRAGGNCFHITFEVDDAGNPIPGLFNIFIDTFTLGGASLPVESGTRDTVLTLLDLHVHQYPGPWRIILTADVDGSDAVLSTYLPPLFQRQVQHHNLALRPRRVRPRLQ